MCGCHELARGQQISKTKEEIAPMRVLGILFHFFSVDGLQLVFVGMSCGLSQKNASYA